MQDTFEVIYQLDETFVIRKGLEIYKLVPEQEWSCNEARLGYLERLYPDRFCIWKRCYDMAIYKKLTILCQTQDSSILLYSTFIGPNGNSFRKGEFVMDVDHAPVFLRHLRASVRILSSKGVVHGDLALRNIVFCPSKTERNNKVISTALPIIIDFGNAFLDAENATKHNDNQWVSLCQFEANSFNPLFLNVDPFSDV